eukprot:CAMPEP_0206219996 /NCGR_PEP_ID=MMETSP0047_2-20121206/4641_1 /ASSEMBLY_ACC=CAM_ASM_000192 /TAXON_ID=195065 /ORGANISM="Chroomonas mesostigmatica_cf, Strain CCMP1168" /LENGTH=58 /DNA_ID=CAMNT_0053642625 /DNA_START=27 /DNA_END=203 /DNA_ORIENTATION=-
MTIGGLRAVGLVAGGHGDDMMGRCEHGEPDRRGCAGSAGAAGRVQRLKVIRGCGWARA